MADNEAIRGRDRHEVCRSIRTPLYYFISYLKNTTHRPCQIYRATDADFIVRSHNELMRILLLITKSRYEFKPLVIYNFTNSYLTWSYNNLIINQNTIWYILASNWETTPGHIFFIIFFLKGCPPTFYIIKGLLLFL